MPVSIGFPPCKQCGMAEEIHRPRAVLRKMAELSDTGAITTTFRHKEHVRIVFYDVVGRYIGDIIQPEEVFLIV